MSRTPVYTARSRFDPGDGESWDKYTAWSGLTQLREVVSLDTSLCPSPLGAMRDEDWSHNVLLDMRIDLFRDLPYMLGRTSGSARVNVLAVMDEPTAADLEWLNPAFQFQGFDLIEEATGISAVTNCGGLVPVAEVASNGLIADLGRAVEVRDAIYAAHPEEPHADCLVWAIWLMRRDG